jgi:hypothetical protein
MMGRHEFRIQKSAVLGFNGNEVFLNIPANEALKLEIRIM